MPGISFFGGYSKEKKMLRNFLAIFAVVAFSLGAASAETVTFDVSGTINATMGSAVCSPSPCVLSGTIEADSITGGTFDLDVVVTGESPLVGPFTVGEELGPVGFPDADTELIINDSSGNKLLLEFTTPTAGTFVGYTGGPLGIETQISLNGSADQFSNATGSLTLAPAVPEPPRSFC
jgi:hypothetical protein